MTDVPVTSKIALTGGADFWHSHAVPEADLPAVMLTDGPHGVRKQAGAADHVGINESVPATCFPPAVGLASTWDPALVERVGGALGEESRALGVGILLGPGANLKRSPLCGRNFEYFSEDPHLTGDLAAAFIKGVQAKGVGTSLKHFAANNAETDRMRRDSQVDERTLREVYLRGFGKAVVAGRPWTVMCAYNKVNGIHASQNPFLLTRVLREEWGFEGFVVSDWGAVQDRVSSLKAGLDLEMPKNAEHQAGVERALAAGEIDEATIDRAYRRVERVLRRASANLVGAPDGFDTDAHHDLARTAAGEAIVLLRNEGILPLAPDADVAVVGEFARTPRYQGAGSSRVNPTRLDNALDALNAVAGRELPFAPGFTTAPGQEAAGDARAAAVAIARTAATVLLFLGLGEHHESEGYDRATMDLPAEQLELLEAILAVNPNVVVVLSNGSSVLLPFADRVPAIVEAWLLGQAGGSAIADVLYGRVNPSGKLAETIPLREQDVPSYLDFPGDATGTRYGEGLFIGYRGYDARGIAVAFPFGHGLSYTAFDYRDLSLDVDDQRITARLTVANTGARAGREVVQAYVSIAGSAVVRVPRELKAFAGVHLEPGETRTVELVIDIADLAFWSVEHQRWVVEGGEYTVQAGSSSRDLRLAGTVTLAGDEPRRLLTLESTMAEAMAVPGFGETLSAIAGAAFSPASMDADMMRMMADIPLYVVAGFSGTSEAELQQLLDQVNEQATADATSGG